MSYPDAPSGCCSFLHFVHASRWIIWMQLCSFAFHFLTSICIQVDLLIKWLKYNFLRFGGKITFLPFWRKIFLRFLKKNMFLAKKCIFVVSAENMFLWVWRKIRFCGLDGKSVFLRFRREKCFRRENFFSQFWREIFFSWFWRKSFFAILVEKLCLSLIHIWRCRRYAVCRSRWSPYH